MPRAESGSALRRAVDAFIRRHALLPPGPVVIAFSGGPDSLLLLHLLADLAPEYGWRLVAAHLDHGLRPASVVEVGTVRALAAARDVPLESERVDVAALAAERGWSPEAAGRVARYRFLAGVAARAGGAPVATGHTQDDQAETLLLRLTRGTGLAGLRAMRPATLLPPSVWHGAPAEVSPRLVRPLLATSRAAIEAELAARGLTPLHDPSNTDPAYTRNRLRHELLPAWEAIAPGVARRLARTADIVAADEAVLEHETRRAWARLDPRLERDTHEMLVRSVTLDRALFLAQPLALQRRLLRQAINLCAPEEPTYAAIDLAVATIARADGGGDVTNQVRVIATGDQVLVGQRRVVGLPPLPPADEPSMAPSTPVALTCDDSVVLPGSAWAITCQHIGAAACAEPLGRLHAHFVPELAAAKPVVRTWRAGDRIALPGLGGRKKLSDFFIDRKVPRLDRSRVPLVVAGDGTVAWIVGLAVGAPWSAKGNDDPVLCCRAVPLAPSADDGGEH